MDLLKTDLDFFIVRDYSQINMVPHLLDCYASIHCQIDTNMIIQFEKHKNFFIVCLTAFAKIIIKNY